MDELQYLIKTQTREVNPHEPKIKYHMLWLRRYTQQQSIPQVEKLKNGTSELEIYK